MGRLCRSAAVRSRAATRVVAALVAVGLVVALPASVLAHPLGNFTINHYTELRVEPDRILLDVVIDQAEIPTFQARFDLDLDGDASLSDEEIEAGRVTACEDLVGSLRLTADAVPLTLRLTAAGLTLPPGVGGLATMRTVCAYEASLAGAIGEDGVDITYADRSFPERAGWREIVAAGSGVTLTGIDGELREESLTDRLTIYPEDRIANPLADTALSLRATRGGHMLAQLVVPDATPIATPTPSVAPTSGPPVLQSPKPAAPLTTVPSLATVPGGVGSADVPDVFRETDLTPFVVALSLAAAAALGAGHALTPGHGKTLMAAYLVGTRGSARHALGLGAAVSLSHTVGILVLAAVVLGATDLVAPDAVVRWAPVVAAVSIVAIGAWMLVGEIRRRRTATDGHPRDHAHPAGHHDDHHHGYGYPHRDHQAPASSVTWRSLFVLGLAGGLIPSTSALLMLLGAIAAGRPAFGLVLVVAFGLGMATVMGGIGLLVVTTRARFERAGVGVGLARVREAVPLVASVVVFGFGVVLTAQALSAVRVL